MGFIVVNLVLVGRVAKDTKLKKLSSVDFGQKKKSGQKMANVGLVLKRCQGGGGVWTLKLVIKKPPVVYYPRLSIYVI